MSHGPDVLVSRNVPVDGRETSISLGGFSLENADRLFPFRADDPALQHMGEYYAAQLRSDQCTDFWVPLALDRMSILWGVYLRSRLVGFTWLTREAETSSPGFALALVESDRGKGIGSLAVAGVLAAAALPGALRTVSDQFETNTPSITTIIHPENLPSQALCTSFGFQHVDTRMIRGGGSIFWKQYVAPISPDYAPPELTPEQVITARNTLATAATQFTTTVL